MPLRPSTFSCTIEELRVPPPPPGSNDQKPAAWPCRRPCFLPLWRRWSQRSCCFTTFLMSSSQVCFSETKTHNPSFIRGFSHRDSRILMTSKPSSLLLCLALSGRTKGWGRPNLLETPCSSNSCALWGGCGVLFVSKVFCDKKKLKMQTKSVFAWLICPYCNNRWACVRNVCRFSNRLSAGRFSFILQMNFPSFLLSFEQQGDRDFQADQTQIIGSASDF